MASYHAALTAHLETAGMTQAELADAINVRQPSVHRYVKGDRFPDAEVAKRIDAATGGAVPFTLWQSIAAERLGIAA